MPAVTVCEDGEVEMEKPCEPVEFTTKVTVVVYERLGLVLLAVMLIVYVPVGVDVDVATVMVEVPAPVIEVGLNPTVTPVGCPVALKEMAELNPPTTELVMLDVPELPSVTVTEDGEADKLKLGFAELPASAFIKPAPFGLPQPVAKSYPFVAE